MLLTYRQGQKMLNGDDNWIPKLGSYTDLPTYLRTQRIESLGEVMKSKS